MRSLLFIVLFFVSTLYSVSAQEYYTVKEFIRSNQEASSQLTLVRGKIALKTAEIKSLELDINSKSAEKEQLLDALNLESVFDQTVADRVVSYKKRDEFETQQEYDDRMLQLEAKTEQIKGQVKSELKIDENTQKLSAISKTIEEKNQYRVRLSETLSELKEKVREITNRISEFATDKVIEIPYIYTLSSYDADGEFFILSRKGSESLLARVPRSEARFFKTNFAAVKIFSHSYNSVACLGEKQYILTRFVLTDSRDGHEYRIVKVGTQVWMAENLAFETKRGSYSYDKDSENEKKFGRLYTWKMTSDACPSGWHLPSDAEWKELESVLGVEEDELDIVGARGVNVGTVLKSEGGWKAGGNGTNKYGLNFLPSGVRDVKGSYVSIDESTRLWTSSERSSEEAYSRALFYHGDKINRHSQSKSIASAVRCVKN